MRVETVAQCLASATHELADAGVATPEWDSELLLRHLLDWDRAALLVRATTPIAPGIRLRFKELVAARAARHPLQHLVGTQDFWHHTFVVTPDVLIPRPETEILVEESLRLLRNLPDPVIVDVGTGSGCIALSLAAERPDAQVHAIDISPAALAVAATNAGRLGLVERVRFHLGDLLEPVMTAGKLDLVVSNPPYVGAAEIAHLAPEIRDHEPRCALVPPGGDRYAIYRRLVAQAARRPVAPGVLVLELGAGMAGDVARLCRDAGLEPSPPLPDLQGHPRVLVCRVESPFGPDPGAR